MTCMHKFILFLSKSILRMVCMHKMLNILGLMAKKSGHTIQLKFLEWTEEIEQSIDGKKEDDDWGDKTNIHLIFKRFENVSETIILSWTLVKFPQWDLFNSRNFLTILFYCFTKWKSGKHLRGQKRRKEKLFEAGYYSWQEKIMNGHSFSLFSSLFLSSHICQIFVGGNSLKPHGLFFFSLFQRDGGKHKISDYSCQNINTWLRQFRQICMQWDTGDPTHTETHTRTVGWFTTLKVQWGCKLFPNSGLDSAAHISGDLDQSQWKLKEVLQWCKVFTRRNFFWSCHYQEHHSWRRYDLSEAVNWKYINKCHLTLVILVISFGPLTSQI